jgi:hypothetical protein
MDSELVSVWSGQKGVYVGSGLREMEGYSTRQGKPGECPKRDVVLIRKPSPVQQEILDALRVKPMSRRELVAHLGKGYWTVSQAVDRLRMYGEIRKHSQVDVEYRCWRWGVVDADGKEL